MECTCPVHSNPPLVSNKKGELGYPIQTVQHITANGKYEIHIERSAVKGQDGFKASVHGDDLAVVKKEVEELYTWLQGVAFVAPVVQKEGGK